MANKASTVQPRFLRARDAARLLAVSESQIRNWAKDGTLTAVDLPGIRAKRFVRADVERLASEWADAK
jgi:excisionase family DNA binding protein